jgi:hypothetical protein
MYAKDTKVAVSQSQIEIGRLLGKVKARQFSTGVDYEKRVARVVFGLHDRLVRFTIALPDPEKVRGQRFEQAERQRWRALLLVIKAKLESVENAIETFEEAFLANIVMPNDQTMAEIARPLIAESYDTKRMPRALLGGAPDPPTNHKE